MVHNAFAYYHLKIYRAISLMFIAELQSCGFKDRQSHSLNGNESEFDRPYGPVRTSFAWWMTALCTDIQTIRYTSLYRSVRAISHEPFDTSLYRSIRSISHEPPCETLVFIDQ